MTGEERDAKPVNPEDFLRAMLKISKEDAETARERAASKAAGGQRGPEHNYGDDKTGP